MTGQQKKLQTAKKQVQQEMDESTEKLQSARDDHEADDIRIDVLKVEPQYLVEKLELKNAEEAAVKDKTAALGLLHGAAALGEAMLVLGEELWPDEKVPQESDYWMPELSPIHRGIWDYFFTMPDGLYE